MLYLLFMIYGQYLKLFCYHFEVKIILICDSCTIVLSNQDDRTISLLCMFTYSMCHTHTKDCVTEVCSNQFVNNDNMMK